jgi:vesicle coat complex subunit
MRVLTFEERRSLAYIEALRLINNEEVDAQVLQKALKALDDYRSEGEGNILGHVNNGYLVLGHK